MGRRKDIFKTPEYRHIEENLDDILKELEEDEEYKDLTLPDEWDREFREVMENAQKESRKKRKHKQILAAAAVLVVLIGVSGVGLRTKVVQGDGILELFESSVEIGDRRYIFHGTDSKIEFGEDDFPEVSFEGETLEALNEQIYEELKRPFFRVNWIPEAFVLDSAIYNRQMGILNIEFSNEEKKIFISQQLIQDEEIKYNITEETKVDTINNENLNQNIEIYGDLTNGGLIFTIEKSNVRLDCSFTISKDECKKMVESIEFR